MQKVKLFLLSLFLANPYIYSVEFKNVKNLLKKMRHTNGSTKEVVSEMIEVSKQFNYGEIKTVEMRDGIPTTFQLAKGQQDQIIFYGPDDQLNLWVARKGDDSDTLTIQKLNSIKERLPGDKWSDNKNNSSRKVNNNDVSCVVYSSDLGWLNIHEGEDEVNLVANDKSSFENLKVSANQPAQVKAFADMKEYFINVSKFNNGSDQEKSPSKFSTFTRKMGEKIKRKMSKEGCDE